MNVRHLAVPVLVASMMLAACKKDPPPPPAPTGPSQEDLDRRRADSIAAVRAREDSVARVRAEEQRAMEAERQRMAAARAALEEMIFFDYDEAALTSDAERVLRQKVEILRNSPAVRLSIEGHADERGSTEYNLALGSRRAEAVREFLVGFGLDPNRFSIQSFGEERPLVNASTESAWARNRRAEFRITAGADQINITSDTP